MTYLGNRIVILELENTVLKCTAEKLDSIPEDFSIKQQLPDKPDEPVVYYVYLREFALKFLEYLGDNFELIIYTSLDVNLARLIATTLQEFKPSIGFNMVIAGSTYSRQIEFGGKSCNIKSYNKILKY